MRRVSVIAASFVFAALFAASAIAQAPAAGAQTATFKMAVIDTGAFGGKDGITRYNAAYTALENEFKPLQTEIDGMVTKYNALGNEIKTLQQQIADNKVPVDQKTLQAKVDEFQNLETNIKRKQEDAKARLERRQPAVVGPIQQEIGKALQDFAKQKGYALILDIARLDNAGLILAFDQAKVDVTKEFIAFFNARPATTATTAAPK
jgi:Skp family chaperone for outer membrane proteins